MATTLFSQNQTAYNNSGTSLNYEFRLEVIENSVNNSNNSSNVTVNFYGRTINSYAGYEQFTSPKATISIDGTQVVNSTVSSIINQSFKLIATYTSDIKHNNDGKKTIAVVGVFNPNSSTSYLPKATSISGNGTLTAINKPSVGALTTSNIKDSSFDAKFTASGTITSKGIQVSLTNFGTVLKSSTEYNSTFSGLDANRTYYVRGYATNIIGTTYTSVVTVKTTWTNPTAPSNVKISVNTSEVILNGNLTTTWTASGKGSTNVSGYVIRLYKGNNVVETVDTNNSNVNYSWGTLSSLGYEVGDTVRVSVVGYSKDWNGVKHYNGGGNGTQVYSDTLTIVSDKFIQVSLNGGAFNKYKMYISVNGGNFVEVKKEKLKVIK